MTGRSVNRPERSHRTLQDRGRGADASDAPNRRGRPPSLPRQPGAPAQRFGAAGASGSGTPASRSSSCRRASGSGHAHQPIRTQPAFYGAASRRAETGKRADSSGALHPVPGPLSGALPRCGTDGMAAARLPVLPTPLPPMPSRPASELQSQRAVRTRPAEAPAPRGRVVRQRTPARRVQSGDLNPDAIPAPRRSVRIQPLHRPAG